MEENIKEIQQAIKENEENKDYEFLSGDYSSLASIFRKQDNQIERLRYLLLTFYVDLSGMVNRNYVGEYGNIERAFGVTLWKEIDITKRKLDFNEEDILKFFDETISNYAVPLPFSYFNIETIKKIILDKLHGEKNLLKKYEDIHNKPNLRDNNYKVELKKGRSLSKLPENYTLVDIETTGLNPKLDHIIEVGCIKIKKGKEFGRYKSIIKTPLELSGKIKKMTGLTDEDLNNAPEMETIALRLWSFLKNEVIVGHNINFDIQFLYINFYETLGKIFDNDYFDTLKLFKSEYPQFKSHSLENICNELKICAGHHRAITDCLVVKDILERVQRKNNDNDFTIIEEGLDEESASKFALNLIKNVNEDDSETFDIALNFCNELLERELVTSKLCKKWLQFVKSLKTTNQQYHSMKKLWNLTLN